MRRKCRNLLILNKNSVLNFLTGFFYSNKNRHASIQFDKGKQYSYNFCSALTLDNSLPEVTKVNIGKKMQILFGKMLKNKQFYV